MARGRRGGFFTQLARNAARAQREAERERRRRDAELARRQREHVRVQAAYARDAARVRAATEREQRQQYLEQRNQEALDLNEQLREYLDDLAGVLHATLSTDDTISFASLRTRMMPTFVPPPHLAEPLPPPKRPGLIQGILPSGERRYREALEEHARAEQRRLTALEQARREHQQATDLRRSQEDEQIAAFELAYRAGDREAVIAYNSMVLERSEYPEGFPQSFRVTYSPESRELVVDYELPSPSVVPEVEAYTYVRARDTIDTKSRKPADRRERYQDLVAAITLRPSLPIVGETRETT